MKRKQGTNTKLDEFEQGFSVFTRPKIISHWHATHWFYSCPAQWKSFPGLTWAPFLTAGPSGPGMIYVPCLAVTPPGGREHTAAAAATAASRRSVGQNPSVRLLDGSSKQPRDWRLGEEDDWPSLWLAAGEVRAVAVLGRGGRTRRKGEGGGSSLAGRPPSAEIALASSWAERGTCTLFTFYYAITVMMCCAQFITNSSLRFLWITHQEKRRNQHCIHIPSSNTFRTSMSAAQPDRTSIVTKWLLIHQIVPWLLNSAVNWTVCSASCLSLSTLKLQRFAVSYNKKNVKWSNTERKSPWILKNYIFFLLKVIWEWQ